MFPDTQFISPLNKIHYACIGFYNHFFVKEKAQRPTPSQSALKICGELGELAETINKGWNIEEQEKELGDVFVTAIIHAINAGYNFHRIESYIYNKLEERKYCCTVVNGMIVKNKDLQGKPIKEKAYGIAEEKS